MLNVLNLDIQIKRLIFAYEMRTSHCGYGKGHDHKDASGSVGGRQCGQPPVEHDRVQPQCDRFRTARNRKGHGTDHIQSGGPSERPRRQPFESGEPDARPLQDGGEQVGTPEGVSCGIQDRRRDESRKGTQGGRVQDPWQQRGQAGHALRGGDDREGCLSGRNDGRAEEGLRQGAGRDPLQHDTAAVHQGGAPYPHRKGGRPSGQRNGTANADTELQFRRLVHRGHRPAALPLLNARRAHR